MGIEAFVGSYRWLSNFWLVDIEYEGVIYPSVEHAYMAAKTRNVAERYRIAMCATPGEAKRMGGKVTLREGWDGMRLIVMEHLLRKKFSHPELRAKLIATDPYQLTEGNHWGDKFWGVCRGEGENHLGRLLMKIRGEIIEREKGDRSREQPPSFQRPLQDAR